MVGLAPEIDCEVVRRMAAEGAQLVEVLPAEEYDREHIAGAVSIPLARLRREAHRLPRERSIIVYCYDDQ
jgi:rhodanese-related sulfurtransferase